MLPLLGAILALSSLFLFASVGVARAQLRFVQHQLISRYDLHCFDGVAAPRIVRIAPVEVKDVCALMVPGNECELVINTKDYSWENYIRGASRALQCPRFVDGVLQFVRQGYEHSLTRHFVAWKDRNEPGVTRIIGSVSRLLAQLITFGKVDVLFLAEKESPVGASGERGRMPGVFKPNIDRNPCSVDAICQGTFYIHLSRDPWSLRKFELTLHDVDLCGYGASALLGRISSISCGSHGAPQESESNQGRKARSCGNPILPLSKAYLPSPKVALLSVPFIFFGGWLNSYGIDRGRLILIAVGWWLMVVSGFCLFMCGLLPLLEPCIYA